MSDIDIIKKILFRLFRITDDGLLFLNVYFTDPELLELLKELKEK